jgi:hypothetical protein
MSDRTRRHQGADWTGDEASLATPTQDPGAMSWGNGFLAALVHSGSGGPQNTGTFSESIYDLVTNTMGTGVNVGQSTTDTARETWAVGTGLGYGTSARGDGWSTSGGSGFGLGLGGSTFTREVRNNLTGQVDQTQQGVGLSGGAFTRMQNGVQVGDFSARGSADTYVGGGANAYTYRQGDRTGIGGNANWSVGANDVNFTTGYGQNQVSASAGNVSFAPRSEQGSVYVTDNGAVGVSRARSSDDVSVSNARVSLQDETGSLTGSVGSFQSGTSFGGPWYGAPQTYDVQAGPDGVRGSAGYSGGGFRATDVNARRQWNDGNEVHAGARTIDTNSSWNLQGGIGPDGLDLRGGMSDGWRVEGANVGASGTWGNAQLEAGRIQHGTNVTGANVRVNGDGLNAGVEQARWGGVQATNMTGSLDAGSLRTTLSVGEYANDEVIEGANVTLDGNGLNAGAQRIELGGQGVKDVNLRGSFGENGEGTFGARLGELQNNNTVEGARLSVDGTGLHAGAENVSAGGWHLRNAGYDFDYGPVSARGSLESIDTGFQGSGLRADVTRDGIAVGADHAEYNQFSMRNLDVRSGWEGVAEQQARLGDLTVNGGGADNVDVRLTENGLSASADNARYSYLALNGLETSQNFGNGLATQELAIGHGHVHDAGADRLSVTANENGTSLSATNARYSYLGLDDARYANSYFDGAVGTELEIGRGRYLGASAGQLDFQRSLLGDTGTGSVRDLNAHGLQLSDVNVGANVGDASASIGADTANILDLNVGSARTEYSNFGLTGNTAVENARLDVINAQNAGGSLSWGGEEIASARTDFRSGLGVESATGQWDATRGTASGQFTNANVGAMYDNTRLAAFGHSVELGRTGVNLNASGSGQVDLSRGTASGNVNFAGSELALFGNTVRAPEWAQAQGSVDASRGAASVQLGGQNGVGANVSLADRNLDVRIGGTTIDVDQGIRDAGTAISNGWNATTSAVSSGASRAWDAVTSW